jgi:hypothetical protein
VFAGNSAATMPIEFIEACSTCRIAAAGAARRNGDAVRTMNEDEWK